MKIEGRVVGGDLRNFGWKLRDEEYEGNRTNSPTVPDSVVLHQAAVGLHGEEAGHKSRKQGHD